MCFGDLGLDIVSRTVRLYYCFLQQKKLECFPILSEVNIVNTLWLLSVTRKAVLDLVYLLYLSDRVKISQK